ncbi:MAG: hypothetical protein B6I20_12010 [Bacteroidetes bacterium 4572_117]|nr:MAG: hypothetical protein B6I20_12010 [Bacteroidetes bacterium 4572_117]
MEQNINIDGININYKVEGEGENVILLHGWGCDLNIFEKIQSKLSEKNKTYAIDFPGFGKSDEPNEIWGVEEYTSLTEKFIQKLNINKPILVGHSFGGRVSILYSSRNKIDKLILVDSAGLIQKSFKKSVSKFLGFIRRITNSNQFVYKLTIPIRKAISSGDYLSASGMMKDILKKVVNEDLSDKLPLIKASTLLIWGEDDTATPLKDAKKMEKLIPNAGLVSFKNVGHYSFLEKQHDFLIILDNFLQNNK